MKTCEFCGKGYFRDDHRCRISQPRLSKAWRLPLDQLRASMPEQDHPGRPKEYLGMTAKEVKAMQNRRYRELGYHSTLGIHTIDKELICELAKAEGIAIIDMVHKLITSYRTKQLEERLQTTHDSANPVQYPEYGWIGEGHE